MEGVIIILGSTNDNKGNLLSIAKERLLQGAKEFKKHPKFKFLLTGGYGKQFNETDKPHAYYAKKFLVKKGIKTSDILEFAESHFSSEDALLSKPIIDKYGVKKILVVTSNYHLKRAKYIFKKVFPKYDLSFSASKTDLSEKELNLLKAHERKALDMVKKKGFFY